MQIAIFKIILIEFQLNSLLFNCDSLDSINFQLDLKTKKGPLLHSD